MRFINEEARHRDPRARLIPKTVFYSSFYFNADLDYLSADFMRDPARGLEKFSQCSSPKRHNYWMAMVYGHPNLSFDDLIFVARCLDLSAEDLFILAATWGNLSFFICLIDRYRQYYSLDTLFEGWLRDGFPPFYFAAEHGHLAIIQYLLDFAAHLTEAMYSAENYKALNLALDNGQEKVVHYLLSFPQVFAYAESQAKFNESIKFFATICLGRLYKKKREFQTLDPRGIFDLDKKEESQLYLRIGYYLLDHEELEQSMVNEVLFRVFSLPSVIKALNMQARNPAKKDLPRILLAYKLIARLDEKEAIQGLLSCKIPNLEPDISQRLLSLAHLPRSRDRFFQEKASSSQQGSEMSISLQS